MNIHLSQKEGLSIGGFLSCMIAIMLANYADHTSVTCALYSSKFIHNKVQILDGVRATDNGLVFVVVNQLKLRKFNNALSVLKTFKKEFVKTLKVRQS